MTGWNYADIWETVAATVPDRPALIHGDRTITWGQMNERANGIARALLDAGVQRGDKVAQYLYNGPEYLESMFGIYKASLSPVNTNYRYADDELVYLWDNADAVAVVFHGTFTERIEGIQSRVPDVKTWLWVDDGAGVCPEWATPYEDAASTGKADNVSGEWGRSGDDIYMLYTGGTTGMPKGVMWRQDDIIAAVVGAQNPIFKEAPDLAKVAEMCSSSPALTALPACPLMHGTGAFTAMATLAQGGTIATLVGRNLDAAELLNCIQDNGVNSLAMVGDAFGKPIIKALDAEPDRWNISSLFMIVSSGVMWSEPVKKALLEHNQAMMLVDAFSSSEALGMGQSVSSAGATTTTAKFVLGENAKVITDDGREVQPGSGDIGKVAVRGRTPIGYYKDPEKSAATFIEIDGERYSIPGDYAQVEADGTLTLLGRGSVCINTAGEKVYPEEVEEVLKTHSGVNDAVAVGVPDERFGEMITAVVELTGDSVDEDDVIAHVKDRLASYKAPKRVLTIDTIGRAPNGKVDYKRLRQYAIDTIG